MEFFSAPSRKVYVHAAEEHSVKEEELKWRVAFWAVPTHISTLPALVEWLKTRHAAVDVLTTDGWMKIPDEVAPHLLPPNFARHVRKQSIISTAFGASSPSPFASVSPTSNPFGTTIPLSPFGGNQNTSSVFRTSTFGSQSGTSLFGGTSSGLFRATQASTSTLGAPPSVPGFGSNSSTLFGGTSSDLFLATQASTSTFGTPSATAFGSNSSACGSGTPVFGHQPLFGSTSFGSSAPTFGSTTLFGMTPFGTTSTPAFGATSTPAFGTPSTPAFSATSTPSFGAASTPAFGASSAPAFSGTSTPAFGAAASTPAFGASSAPAFSASASPAFGASSTPLFGSTSFGSSAPAFGSTTLFGVTPSGTTSAPAFDANSTLAFGTTSTPAFSATSTPAFGAASTPAFGASSAPVFSSSSSPSFGASSTPLFGATSSWTPAVGQSTFSQCKECQHCLALVKQITSLPSFGSTPMSGSGGASKSAFDATSTPAFGAASTQPLELLPLVPLHLLLLLPHQPLCLVLHPSSLFGSSTPAFGQSNFNQRKQMTDQCQHCLTLVKQITSLPCTSMYGSDGAATAFGANKSGADSTPAFGANLTPAFGVTSTPASSSTPAFGASPSPPFGSLSTPLLGATSSSLFGSSTPLFGQSTFSQRDQMTDRCRHCLALIKQITSSPLFGSTSTYGSGIAATAFGAQSTPAFGCSPSFGSTFNAPFGSQQASYVPTNDSEVGICGQVGKLIAITAMPTYKIKSIEELRWEDYQSGVIKAG